MTLHLHAWGDEDWPLLVCLHGLTGHGRRFERLAARWRRRVVAPDLRGHGRSAWAPPWTTEQHVADVLGAVPGGCVDWLGFSFGGRIAAAVACAAPERVRRLVLLDPALTVPADLCFERAEGAREEVTYASREEAVRAALDQGTLFSTPREVVEADVHEHLALRADGRLEERFCRAMAVTAWSEMARPAPPAADVRTLLVTGDRSWLPVDPALRPDAWHVRVPGGHNVVFDDEQAVASAVADFLA